MAAMKQRKGQQQSYCNWLAFGLEKKFQVSSFKVLCHCYSVPHLVILFADWVITTLRVIIFAGTKFHRMFIHCIKLPRKFEEKRFYPAQKNW